MSASSPIFGFKSTEQQGIGTIIDILIAKVAPFVSFCTEMKNRLEQYNYEHKQEEEKILRLINAFEHARDGLYKDLREAFVLIKPHFGTVLDVEREFKTYLNYFQEFYKVINDAEKASKQGGHFAVHDTPFPYFHYLESPHLLPFFKQFDAFLIRRFNKESLLLEIECWKSVDDAQKRAMLFDLQHASPRPSNSAAVAEVAVGPRKRATAADALQSKRNTYWDSFESQLAQIKKYEKEDEESEESEESEYDYDYEESGEEQDGAVYSRLVKLRF